MEGSNESVSGRSHSSSESCAGRVTAVHSNTVDRLEGESSLVLRRVSKNTERRMAKSGKISLRVAGLCCERYRAGEIVSKLSSRVCSTSLAN